MYLIIFAILLISLIIALYAQNNNPKKSNLKSSYIKKKGVFFERTLSINHFRGFESMFLHVQTDDGLIYKSERLFFFTLT